MLMVMSPSVRGFEVMCPARVAAKLPEGSDVSLETEVPFGVAVAWCRSELGVPARAAQPCCCGPLWYQTKIATGTTIAAAAAAILGAFAAGLRATRTSTDAATSANDAKPTNAIHPNRASLPVPKECMSAIGQDAYASQCTARHMRTPRRVRKRLVMTSASSRSNATVPSPSQKGRYGDTSGISASLQ